MRKTVSLVLRILALALVIFVVLPVAAALTGVAGAEAPKGGASAPESSAGAAVLPPAAVCLLSAAGFSRLVLGPTLFCPALPGGPLLLVFCACSLPLPTLSR